jgi:glycosyltransferase involved in cell wall biosynthesis
MLYLSKIQSNISFQKEFDLFKVLSSLYFKVFDKINSNLHFKPFSRKDGYHFFNVISLSNSIWITTFETCLPHFSNVPSFIEKLTINKLASNNCKQIIALSNCSYAIQKEFLVKNYPKYIDTIMAKCMVLHPPQELIVESAASKLEFLNKDCIVFTMIGADFFRKGGAEVLKVFKKIESLGIKDWHLNIVSSMKYGDYASKTTLKDQQLAFKIIEESKNITLFDKLSNKEVLNLFKESHIGLLPTWADTYGYAILEAQVCGCPVISTDIMACPEINDDSCGWLIKAPKDELGNGILNKKNERMVFSTILCENLFNVIEDIINNPKQIIDKSNKSINRILENHNFEKHSNKLNEIYSNLT